MSSTLKPKRSSVASAVPTTANLQDGEFAVNVADKKIFQRVGSTIHTIANFFSGAWADITGKPSVTAGNGMTGGGLLDVSRTLTLGTPGTITGESTNSVTSTSHTHSIGLNYSPADVATAAANYPGSNPSVSLILSDATWPAAAGTALTAHADGGGNRVFQLFAASAGGTETPSLYLRASHTTTGGGGWTGFEEIWHSGNLDPAALPVTQINSLDDVGGSGFFKVQNDTNTNLPPGWLWAINHSYASAYNFQLIWQNGTENYYLRSEQGGAWNQHRKVWHSGNLLPPAESPTASTLAQRTSQGDVQARLFRMGFGSPNATVNYIITCVDPSGADNYMRPSTPAQVRAAMAAVENVSGVASIRKMTQAAYNALGTKDANTLYVIVG